MRTEVELEFFLDLWVSATSFMKPKDVKKFTERYFQILETFDIDLNDLLNIATDDIVSDEDNGASFTKMLEEYLDDGDDDYEDGEDW